MARFVLEIGTEELPPRFFRPVLGQLRQDGEAMLSRARLGCREVVVYGAPRRLVLIAEEMAARQAPAVREERGPAVHVAFDAEGKPTRAAEGFARRHGVKPEDLVRRRTDQGEYVFAILREPEEPAAQALAKLLPELIAGLSFPKTMRWGEGSLRFGRPIRWLLALVDDGVVEFELAGLRSGRLTRGHPTLANRMVPVTHAEQYEATLEGVSVLVNPDQRRLRVRQWLDLRAKESGGRWADGGLLEETVFLVEWPTADLGSFDETFLSLPRPVLVTEMQHVQAFFPLEDEQGNLLPRFIGVRDGGTDHLDRVRAGWESVLRAKLIDASFFYHQDLKRPLADRVQALRGVVFQEKLGSMYEKVERVRRLAAQIAQQLALDAHDAVLLDRAALLCKADLTTEVVAELSDLQGVMGGVYARHSGEPEEVATAIEEHYRPRGADDAIPESKLGRLLAVADKTDTICACLALGLVPTGSADPYGLRREATGVVRILTGASGQQTGDERAAARGIRLDYRRVVERAIAQVASEAEIKEPIDTIVATVMDFIRQRLATILRDEEGIRYDLVDAALAVGVEDLARAYHRAWALRLAESRDGFLPTVISATRVSNITRGFAGGEPDPARFEHESERALWEAYQKVAQQADGVPLIVLFELLRGLREPIDRYFEDVLVMAEDPELRRNRLATCWTVHQLFRRLADFALVVQA